MKSIKKVLAMALALAMVVTAVPVTSAEAASTAKLSASKVTVAKGDSKAQVKTVKVTTPSTWKSVKVTATSANKKIAKVSVSGKSVKVRAVKAGKSTTVKVKVTAKKSGKSVSKTLKLTAKVVAAKLAISASDVTVGSTVNVSVTKKVPSAATVTYASSDEKIATVDANGVVTGVASGKATITATSNYGSVATADVNVGKYAFESVTQSKLTEITAVISGATSELKASDFTVVDTTTKVTYPVSAVKVDSKDATKVTLTMFSELKNDEFEVTLDGVTKSFKASDGTIASIAVDPVTIPYNTEKKVQLVSKDANGVVLAEMPYGSTDAKYANYEFTINTNGNGYTNGSALCLYKIGDTATAEITYKSGKYDADGKATGNIGPQSVTITAVDQSSISDFAVRVDDDNKSFAKAENTNKIAVDETKTAYLQIKDADGEEVATSVYSSYTVESSDKSVLMIDGTKLTNKSIVITAAKVGTAYILLKDSNNNVVASLSIDVVAERAVATLELTPVAITVSNDSQLDQQKTASVVLKDQYGTKWSGEYSVTPTYLTGTDSNGAAVTNEPSGLVSVTTGTVASDTVKVAGKDVPAGVYTYKISYTLKGKEIVAKTLTVTVQQPASGSVDGYRLDVAKTSVDTTISETNKSTISFDISVMGTVKGVDKAKQGDVTYKVTKVGGSDVYGGTNAITGAAFNIDSNGVDSATFTGTTLTVTPLSVSNGHAVKNLEAGTYNVYVSFGTSPNVTSLSSSFTITDTQKKATANLHTTTYTSGQTVKNILESDLRVYYNGELYSANASDTNVAYNTVMVAKAKAKASNGDPLTESTAVTSSSFAVSELYVTVNVTDDVTLDVEVSNSIPTLSL